MMTGFQKNWLPLMLVAVLSLGFATAALGRTQGYGRRVAAMARPRYGHGPRHGQGHQAAAWVMA